MNSTPLTTETNLALAAEEWAADDLTAVLHDMGDYTAPWL